MVEPKGKNSCLTLRVDLFALSVLPNLPVLVELCRPVGFLTGDADALI